MLSMVTTALSSTETRISGIFTLSLHDVQNTVIIAIRQTRIIFFKADSPDSFYNAYALNGGKMQRLFFSFGSH